MSDKYGKIPQRTCEAIDRYVENGTPTGGFLKGVLSNDLTETIIRADYDNLEALQDILAYCYWEIPAECWGSRERVRRWVEDADFRKEVLR
jgi:hypothetical protein